MPSKIGPNLPPSSNRPSGPKLSPQLEKLKMKIAKMKTSPLQTSKNTLDGRAEVAPRSSLSKKFLEVLGNTGL